jgi:hypothetical protein
MIEMSWLHAILVRIIQFLNHYCYKFDKVGISTLKRDNFLSRYNTKIYSFFFLSFLSPYRITASYLTHSSLIITKSSLSDVHFSNSSFVTIITELHLPSFSHELRFVREREYMEERKKMYVFECLFIHVCCIYIQNIVSK